MPTTTVLFFQEEDGSSQIVEWLRELKKNEPKGFINCLVRVAQLKAQGYELRRPAADFLREGIYELRARHKKVQYRLLYFFHGQNVAVIDHGIIKEQSKVPDVDLERALERKRRFEENPEAHTFKEEIDDEEKNN